MKLEDEGMELTHFNPEGRAQMVDVSGKEATFRVARAAATVRMAAATAEKIRAGQIGKGDVLAVAQVAGIMAAKKNSELIPMCHPLMLTKVDLRFSLEETALRIFSEVRCRGETGVEMEALAAVSVAALTVYDMCKAAQKDMEITDIHLLYKEGGKSGVYRREGEARVTAVNISERRGTPKHPVPYLELRLHHGIVGDAHAGDWHRQISLLAEESVDKMRAMGLTLTPGAFAENINTTGIVLTALPVGTVLEIGETAVRVTQIGKECHSDCEIRRITGQCVMPTEGIFAEVVREGRIYPGDAIVIKKECGDEVH